MRVEIEENRIYIQAIPDDTTAWATRPSASWPCSDLRGSGVNIELDSRNGDLLDVYVTGEDGLKTLDYEGGGDELTAFCDDTLTAIAETLIAARKNSDIEVTFHAR